MRYRGGYWAWFLAAILIAGTGFAKADSDIDLREEIHAKFMQDSGLQDKTITVEISNGVVTLSGTVDTDAERTAASRYASATPGVEKVVNNLEVARVAGSAAPVPAAEAASADSSPVKGEPVPAADPEGANVQPAQEPTSSIQDAPTPMRAPEPRLMTIEAGTSLAVRLVDELDSESAQEGQRFRATLDSPLAAEWDVAIPSGYNVEGHVVEVKSAGKFAGQSELVLTLDKILVRDKSYDIQTDDYRRKGQNQSAKTAEKVGVGAALGAIIGGIAGGGKGAGIGAAAGGGIGGATQAAGKGKPVRLESETVLNFTLQTPVTVAQVEESPERERQKLRPAK